MESKTLKNFEWHKLAKMLIKDSIFLKVYMTKLKNSNVICGAFSIAEVYFVLCVGLEYRKDRNGLVIRTLLSNGYCVILGMQSVLQIIYKIKNKRYVNQSKHNILFFVHQCDCYDIIRVSQGNHGNYMAEVLYD